MSETPATIKIVTAAVFKSRKLLMTREDDSGDAFYVPGGTIEPGESDLDCLKREILEELGIDVDEKSIQFLNEFVAPAHGKINTIVNMRLYKLRPIGNPTPTGEVLEIRYFDSTIPKKHQAPISKQVFDWLKENDYVD